MHHFEWPIRIYYEDTDAGGVVFYANYLKFFERTRTELLRHLGFEQDLLIRDEGTLFVVRSLDIDYLQPARFNEKIIVTAKITSIKKVSLTFSQTAIRGDDLLCQGNVRIACLDSRSMRPKPIPEFLLESLQNEC
ncbi:MAG: tol-pal system-associated acyl-CoA thioesterase [Gammaproteobacteria bacterium]